MQVPFATLDKLVTSALNLFKEEARMYRDNVLTGKLTIEDYKFQTGVLVGLELAASILKTAAKKIEHDDDND